MPSLAGKRIVIVGASSGIGLPTARHTAKLRAHCIMISRSRERRELTAREVGGSTEAHAINMLDEAAVADLFLRLRGAAGRMADNGSITFVSGASALKPPREGMSVSAAGNGAIIMFARALALELAPIPVNAVAPGIVDTAVWDPEQRGRIAVWAESPDLPARRFGQPDDIAEAIAFLIQNPYMTGHNLVIDGGLTAT